MRDTHATVNVGLVLNFDIEKKSRLICSLYYFVYNYLIISVLDRSVEVLQNIIENAIKYGDGHLIRMDFSEEEDCRLIAVSNSGCTLPENEIPHIFESFWRGSNADGKSGSGLGLYICRQLLNQMDGDIFAECVNGVISFTVVLKKA